MTFQAFLPPINLVDGVVSQLGDQQYFSYFRDGLPILQLRQQLELEGDILGESIDKMEP